MLKANFVDVIYTHTEGDPTCIVYGGIPFPFGTDILQKRQFLDQNYDWLRRALMREPRGHKDMYAGFITPPSGPDTDAGVIWADGEIYNEMCGHGTIALGMAMVSYGLVPPTGNLTKIRLETTAGLVTAEVGSTDGTVDWCRFENVPAFVAERDVSIELPEFGQVTADIVFGGNYFAIIEWKNSNWRICPENASFFSRLGRIAKNLLDEKVKVQHPTQRHITSIDLVTFFHEPTRPGAMYRCVHTVPEARQSDLAVARSPGGTGTSAMMAMFEARGRLKLNQPIQGEGLLGSGTFEGCLIGETRVGDQRAIISTVKGKSYIIGYAKWLIDPTDPLKEGFVLS